MPKAFPKLDDRMSDQPGLERYFIQTGFYDLLPLAIQLAEDQGYDSGEMSKPFAK